MIISKPAEALIKKNQSSKERKPASKDIISEHQHFDCVEGQNI